MECKKCSLSIDVKNDLYTVCDESCLFSFHAQCVDLSAEKVNAIGNNVVWLCNECMALCVDMFSKRICDQGESQQQDIEIVKDVKELKSQVASVNRMRSSIKPLEMEIERLKTDVIEMKEMINGLSLIDYGTPKDAITQGNECYSTTSISMPSLTSTRITANRITEGQRNDSSSKRNVTRTTKLHISNIANDVTEDEVLQMISNAIGVKEVLCIKCLVPGWRDVMSLDYISFKIEIDDNYREAALKRSNWPKGVRCREFVDYGETTRRPIRAY